LGHKSIRIRAAGSGRWRPLAVAVAVAVAVAMAMAMGCQAQETRPARETRQGIQTRAVRIAAAADLRYALEEITRQLKQARPDLDLQVAYGSSGTFFAQLVNGAPFDLFMSADIEYPRQLAARGLTVPDTEFTYGIGRLVLWVPAISPLDVEKAGMEALADPRVAHIAIANPEHAPYGRAAEAAMRRANVYDRVKSRIVFGENVSQALQFVQSGAAQASLVALSLAIAPAIKPTGRFWAVPGELHPRMDQGGVILRAAADVEAARAVRAFLQGDRGRAILKQYGFSLPGD
jgi:molybdate transport system substrate-binding protein